VSPVATEAVRIKHRVQPIVTRIMTCASLIALALGAVSTPILADGLSTLNFSLEALSGGKPGGAVNVNGARLMTIRSKHWSAASAAKQAAQALRAAAIAGTRPDAISVQQEKGGYAIFAGKQRILLVDRAMAAALHSSREALARQWAQRIREVFARPYLAASVDSQIVPVGERRVVFLRGSTQQIRVAVDSQIVRAECPGAGSPRLLFLTGVSVGQAQVVLDIGTAKLTLPVRVMKYAGRVAATAEATVTGRIAPAEVIRRAASAALYYTIEAEPGASAVIIDMIASMPYVTPGGVAAVTMRVTVAGPGYIPVSATLQVRVVNEPVPASETQVLMVSNRPERLPAWGMWYQGRVPAGHPARLLYHHVNATGVEGELAVELLNPGDRPVRVQIVEASGGPSNDEVFVGHKAARDFLQRQADDVGYVVSIPGGCAYTSSAQLLKPGQVISGLTEVRVLGDGELRVAVRLRPPSASLLTPTAATPPEHISTWVFAEPHKRFEVPYTIGSQWAFATIGDKQVLSSTGRELLDGDYGVFYDITFDIENPTSAPARVELALMPGGGLARGVVMIEGQIYETGLLRYGESERLFAMTIPARGHRQLQVRTIPEAGSNYPVKLVVRPQGVWE